MCTSFIISKNLQLSALSNWHQGNTCSPMEELEYAAEKSAICLAFQFRNGMVPPPERADMCGTFQALSPCFEGIVDGWTCHHFNALIIFSSFILSRCHDDSGEGSQAIGDALVAFTGSVFSTLFSLMRQKEALSRPSYATEAPRERRRRGIPSSGPMHTFGPGTNFTKIDDLTTV